MVSPVPEGRRKFVAGSRFRCPAGAIRCAEFLPRVPRRAARPPCRFTRGYKPVAPIGAAKGR